MRRPGFSHTRACSRGQIKKFGTGPGGFPGGGWGIRFRRVGIRVSVWISVEIGPLDPIFTEPILIHDMLIVLVLLIRIRMKH